MLSEVKQRWVSVSIPKGFSRRIRAILGFVADESLAEYARQAIQVRLKDDENRAEEAKMEEKEIRERLQ
ncbi:unnamed protein product [marine sediment metagenome]|uniref:Uncharacterized protein n=1 Tax=marine sediment metagenome TaxID=412755 RepID=X1S4B3_9ZZZZ